MKYITLINGYIFFESSVNINNTFGKSLSSHCCIISMNNNALLDIKSDWSADITELRSSALKKEIVLIK